MKLVMRDIYLQVELQVAQYVRQVNMKQAPEQLVLIVHVELLLKLDPQVAQHVDLDTIL